jgi:Bacterial SH3 domain
MNWTKHWKPAVTFAVALAMLVVLGREARAETLYAERAAELRGSPADDAQVVKRVGKGKSLDVVKRLGTWVMVKYEGRTGWIRRTALSTDKAGGSSASDVKKEARAKKKSRDKSKKSKKRNKVVEADPEDEVEAEEDEGLAKKAKAAAAGAKRLAAKRKAERRKSRSSRRSTGDEEEEAQEEEEVAAAEETEPRRPRSSWGKRSAIPGGPLKVEVQASSVQAFAQPDGTGRVVFTAAEGDTVRVLSRAENRWLLVENTKKRQGWIPAVAVRDHGLLLDARKDASALADSGSTDTEAPDADEQEIAQVDEEDEPKRKSRTAAASDGDSDDADVEEDEKSKSDDEEEDASVAADSDEAKARRSPWSIGGSLRGGYSSVVQDITPAGIERVQQARYAGPSAGLVGDITYRLQPKLSTGLELNYDFTSASTTFNDNGTELPETYSLTHHRIGASAAVSYGERAITTARAGFLYAALQYSDLENEAQLPRESTSGPTVGLGFSYAEIAGTKFGARVGADALLFASRSQTQGSRDGELDSLNALWGTLGVDYLLGTALTVGLGYRFGYTTATWVGTSERIPEATSTERTDLSHEIFAGVGYRL